MPFIGRDWRSPGEAWIKTETLGWQRLKLMESHLHAVCGQGENCSWPPNSEFGHHMTNNCGHLSIVHHTAHCPVPVLAQPLSESRDEVPSPGASSCSDSGVSNLRDDSASPTPSSSPEKSYPQHHTRSCPITISSPYGRYSYCGHQLDYDSYKQRANLQSPKSQSPVLNKKSHTQTNHPQGNDNRCLPRSSSASQSDALPSSSSSSRMQSQAQLQTQTPSSARQSQTSSLSCSVARQHGNNIDNIMNKFALLRQNSNGNKNDKDINNGYWRQNKDAAAKSDDSGVGCHSCRQPISNEALEPGQAEGYSSPTGCFTIDDVTNNPDQTTSTSASHCSPRSSEQPSSPHHHLCNHDQTPWAPDVGSPTRNVPHCRISVRTREVAMYNTISEAFYRLDFCNAVHDIRRFNYICKLLHLLITQNLTSLSGCATKALFTMLEQVACEVATNKRNIHVLRNLLTDLKLMIEKYYCWGRPIGSSQLWQQHFDTIERISQMLDDIDIAPQNGEQQKSDANFNKLPVEMIREILLRFNDYHDLLNSAKASPVMRSMINDQEIWRRLCQYHFTEQQVKMALDWHKDGQPANKFAKTSRNHHSKQRKQPSAHEGAVTVARSHRIAPAAAGPSPSSSYVTRTIRIFDQKKLRSVSLDDENENPEAGRRPKHPKQVQKSASATNYTQNNPLSQHQSAPSEQAAKSSKQQPSVDWEQIFHQLRKKFNLKEEYADCLLLCRHCRCLFWKSFGHPCIKDDEQQHQDSATSRQKCNQTESGAPVGAKGSSNQGACYCDKISQQRRQIIDRQQQNQASLLGTNRVSVAALSKNFDASGSPNQASSSSSAESHGGLPTAHRTSQPQPQGHVGRQCQSNSASVRCAMQQLQANICAGAADRHNNNNHNPSPLDHVRRQQQQLRASGRNPNSHANPSQQPQQASKELVPKHVTISPQAFLKFFSL